MDEVLAAFKLERKDGKIVQTTVPVYDVSEVTGREDMGLILVYNAVFRDDGRILMMKRADNDHFFGGYYSFPTETVRFSEEDGRPEKLSEAVSRCLRDECGLDPYKTFPLFESKETEDDASRLKTTINYYFPTKYKINFGMIGSCSLIHEKQVPDFNHEADKKLSDFMNPDEIIEIGENPSNKILTLPPIPAAKVLEIYEKLGFVLTQTQYLGLNRFITATPNLNE